MKHPATFKALSLVSSLSLIVQSLGVSIFMMATPAPVMAGADNDVTICHATSSNSNPYNTQSPDKSGDVSGHDNHNGGVYPASPWGDIIPEFNWYGCSENPSDYTSTNSSKPCKMRIDGNWKYDGLTEFHYSGQNWTTEGQAIWNSGCMICGEKATHETTSDMSNYAVDIDFRDYHNYSGTSNDGYYKISVTAQSGFKINNVWLDVSDDGYGGYHLYATGPLTDFNPSGDQINEAKVEVERVCIVDTDSDGIEDSADNCPTVANADQLDQDSDTLGDVCDLCPSVADATNQYDDDGDGLGNSCDACNSRDHTDTDGDGIENACDAPDCGNGYLETGEVCDDGSNNGAGCTPTYGTSCQYCGLTCNVVISVGPSCGDGVISNGEMCDPSADPNFGDGMYCADTCTIETSGYKSECLATSENMLTNGSFETPAVLSSDGWDIYLNGTSGLGWSVVWEGGIASFGGETRPETADLELHKGVNGWTTIEGSQYAELDSDWNGHLGSLNGEPANVSISQTLTTVPGTTYRLSYYYSPRPDVADNALEVRVNGALVNSHSISGVGKTNTFWSHYTTEFMATTASTKVEFAATGLGDSLGVFLDGVALYATDCYTPQSGNLKICKFNDVNMNGLNDDDSPLHWDMTVEDTDGTDSGEKWITATNNETGCVTLKGMDLGQYEVTEALVAGWTQSYPGNNGTLTLDLTTSSPDVTVTFLNYETPTYSIHGYKWDDQNNNGERDCVGELKGPVMLSELSLMGPVCDIAEPLLSGWTIFIDEDLNGELGSEEPSFDTSSDPAHLGWYWFEGLVAGNYRVCEVMKQGWNQTYPVNPVCHEVTLPEQFLSDRLVSLNAVSGPEYNFGNYYVGYCGDSIVNNEEACDGLAGVGENEVCSKTCQIITLEHCGDTVRNGNEECDGVDGVGANQHCSATCTLINDPYCGDGIKNNTEACDGTDGVGAHQTCTTTCSLQEVPYCGDGAINGTETCDDGNIIAGDGCSATCTTEPLGVVSVCGNNTTETGEDCDGDDTLAGKTCTDACKFEAGSVLGISAAQGAVQGSATELPRTAATGLPLTALLGLALYSALRARRLINGKE